jgi:PAP2 superfamily.
MKWQWLVAPGSAIYLIPLVLLVGGAVILRDRTATNAVLRWWAAVAGVCVLVAASKISFYGWGIGIRAWDLTCFSGHTALSVAVWPVVLTLLIPLNRPGWRLVGAITGAAFGGLIGYSRIPLGAHPASEVIAGALLGCLAAVPAARALGRSAPPPTFTPLILLATALWIAIPPSHISGLSSERWFAKLGAKLSGSESLVERRRNM